MNLKQKIPKMYEKLATNNPILYRNFCPGIDTFMVSYFLTLRGYSYEMSEF